MKQAWQSQIDLMQYVSYPTPARVNGGGELQNLGSHPVDLIHHAFGMPNRVYAHFETAYWNDYYDPFGTEDVATLMCEYDTMVATVVVGRNRVSTESGAVDSIDLWCRGVHARASVDTLEENGKRWTYLGPPSRGQRRASRIWWTR